MAFERGDPKGDLRARQRLFDDAVADHRTGRLDAAKAKYAELIRRDPQHGDAFHLLGQIAFTQGQPEQAITLVKRAIGADRRVARYHDTLALMLNRLGRAVEAETAARGALALERNDPAIYVNLATACQALGRLDEAETALARALALAPDHRVALANRGVVLLEAGKLQAAEKQLRRAVEIDPANPVAWASLGAALHELERPAEAESAARRALALQVDHAPAHALLGVLRLEAGDIAQAIASAERAHALRPNEPRYLGNLANAHLAAGDADTALAAYDRSIAAHPDDAKTVYNKALCQMRLGQLDAGLENYELRWGVPDAGFAWRASDLPVWTAEAPSDVALLVWSEQGIGDHIFAAGFLTALTALGARVIFECDARLTALMARSFPQITVIAAGTPPPAHDYHIPAASLMRVLRARLGEMPAAESGWMRAAPERVAAARASLAEWGSGPYVGVSWRSARKIVGAHKSMPLALWTPILCAAAARFVNLQYGDCAEEIAAARAVSGVDIQSMPGLDRFNDIEGLAALIEALDLVITTSNVTAHIAGALGKETWVAVQKVPLWYWGCTGDTSPYYPSAKLVRQVRVGDWSDVIARLAGSMRAVS